ncbi:MAG: ATP phosphoribosyltransferase regulatory subunit [Oscillospiraceae bacterium]|nr:ATP phosphoribosyltransferase regulatory subunit [Oscillospiraceae bacterium]
MKRYDLITPEGTRDLLLNDCTIRKNIENYLRGLFESAGYSELNTPCLEFYDVFNKETVYFPQEAMYKLSDRKGRLMVLRPDCTVPIARVVATRLREAKLPIRLFYNQSVYTPSRTNAGKSDEIFQSGIELIGSASKKADLEVLTLAAEVLSHCDSDKFRLEIGDSGFFKVLIGKLTDDPGIKEKIRVLIEAKNYPALNDFLDTFGSNSVISTLKQLPSLFGGEEVFDKVAKYYHDAETDKILSDLKWIYTELSKLGYEGKITVDLGIVNRADYYTGVIMKGYLQGYGDEVLSGGRYDKLISEFGYDVHATGFAVNVDAVAEILKRYNPVAENSSPDVLVFSEEDDAMDALIYVEKLRKEGKKVEFSLFDTYEETMDYAKENKISEIIRYRGEENE